MGKHGLTFYPYKFMLEYKLSSIDCIYDHQQAMYYIVHKGKKLYFPKRNEVNNIRVLYRSLIIEQDIRSPHCYLNDLSRLAGKTVLDIGAAEGIFALEVVELVKHLYLFECDEHWLKALNATFAPWKEKVTIVEKYVSDVDDELNITIDRFLEEKDKRNLFLKMDIEGYEQAALKGAVNTLKEAHDLDYAICTYHRADDAEAIGKLFSDNHFESEFTDGFLYFAEHKSFRKGMIRRKI
ncbi:hypothetical protein AGMMS49965_05630 [Bacteroidia bacterium]|nr:hypothetical protein AGMMS49965_05630 [Bacteroidia bacterium]